MQKPSDTIDIFLQPGEYFFSDASTRIRTVLGSCVAITIWHPRLHMGGMCHIMLPNDIQQKKEDPCAQAKYADQAIALFMADISKIGTKPMEYKVKIFGGGDMFPHHKKANHILTIGEKNIARVRDLLKEKGFSIDAEHLGSDGHRYVIFELWSGFVWLRHHRLKNAA